MHRHGMCSQEGCLIKSAPRQSSIHKDLSWLITVKRSVLGAPLEYPSLDAVGRAVVACPMSGQGRGRIVNEFGLSVGSR